MIWARVVAMRLDCTGNRGGVGLVSPTLACVTCTTLRQELPCYHPASFVADRRRPQIVDFYNIFHLTVGNQFSWIYPSSLNSIHKDPILIYFANNFSNGTRRIAIGQRRGCGGTIISGSGALVWRGTEFSFGRDGVHVGGLVAL